MTSTFQALHKVQVVAVAVTLGNVSKPTPPMNRLVNDEFVTTLGNESKPTTVNAKRRGDKFLSPWTFNLT